MEVEEELTEAQTRAEAATHSPHATAPGTIHSTPGSWNGSEDAHYAFRMVWRLMEVGDYYPGREAVRQATCISLCYGPVWGLQGSRWCGFSAQSGGSQCEDDYGRRTGSAGRRRGWAPGCPIPWLRQSGVVSRPSSQRQRHLDRWADGLSGLAEVVTFLGKSPPCLCPAGQRLPSGTIACAVCRALRSHLLCVCTYRCLLVCPHDSCILLPLFAPSSGWRYHESQVVLGHVLALVSRSLRWMLRARYGVTLHWVLAEFLRTCAPSYVLPRLHWVCAAGKALHFPVWPLVRALFYGFRAPSSASFWVGVGYLGVPAGFDLGPFSALSGSCYLGPIAGDFLFLLPLPTDWNCGCWAPCGPCCGVCNPCWA